MLGQPGKLWIRTGAGQDLGVALVPCRADQLGRLEWTGLAQGGASTGQGIVQGYGCLHKPQTSQAPGALIVRGAP
jgi:hypothetical protein